MWREHILSVLDSSGWRIRGAAGGSLAAGSQADDTRSANGQARTRAAEARVARCPEASLKARLCATADHDPAADRPEIPHDVLHACRGGLEIAERRHVLRAELPAMRKCRAKRPASPDFQGKALDVNDVDVSVSTTQFLTKAIPLP